MQASPRALISLSWQPLRCWTRNLPGSSPGCLKMEINRKQTGQDPRLLESQPRLQLSDQAFRDTEPLIIYHLWSQINRNVSLVDLKSSKQFCWQKTSHGLEGTKSSEDEKGLSLALWAESFTLHLSNTDIISLAAQTFNLQSECEKTEWNWMTGHNIHAIHLVCKSSKITDYFPFK